MTKPETSFMLLVQNYHPFTKIKNRSLFNLEDDQEEAVFYCSNSFACRTRRNDDDVKQLTTQLRGFDESILLIYDLQADLKTEYSIEFPIYETYKSTFY